MDQKELLERYAAGERNFQGAKLNGLDLKGANLGGINLQNADLTGCELNEANLSNASLHGANFSRVSLLKANLTEAQASSVNLERAGLQGANLMGANLEGANVRRADLTDANIYGANMKDADFSGAIMPDGEIHKSQTSAEESNKQEALPKKSMTRQVIRTEQAPAPVGPYNQAIVATGQTIFVAGQIAIDLRIGDIVYRDDVAKQTEQVMSHLQSILKSAGATFQDVVKTTVYLADMNDFAAMNAVYAKYFDEANAPARATVQVSRLPKDALVEIDCIAVIDSQ